MSRLQHIIPSAIAEGTANAAQAQRQTAIYGARPPLAARETWAGSGLTRTLTLQVINQRLEACHGRFLVAVLLGGEGATVTCTYSVTDGVELDAFTAAQGGLFLTAADGSLELEIDQTGSWTTLVPRVTSISPFQGPDATDWQANAGAGGGGGGIEEGDAALLGDLA